MYIFRAAAKFDFDQSTSFDLISLKEHFFYSNLYIFENETINELQFNLNYNFKLFQAKLIL